VCREVDLRKLLTIVQYDHTLTNLFTESSALFISSLPIPRRTTPNRRGGRTLQGDMTCGMQFALLAIVAFFALSSSPVLGETPFLAQPSAVWQPALRH